MHPRLGGRDRLPGRPLLESAFECILGAVLRRGPVAQHRRQRAENLSVRSLIKSLEVRFVACSIRVSRFSGSAGGPCRDRLCHIQSFTPREFGEALTWPLLSLTNLRPVAVRLGGF